MRQSNHGIHIALYDAEGRICAQERYGVYTGYMYDAAGSRIAKGSITSNKSHESLFIHPHC